MADWDDEETTNVGRSFGNTNLNSGANNDDDWGNGQGSGGGANTAGGADDDWGAGNENSAGNVDFSNGGNRRNGGDRGDRRGGFGGGGEGGYNRGRRDGENGGGGGGYNRGRRDDENGVGNATTTLQYSSNRQNIKIPNDFEKSTVVEFLNNLNFADYDTLLTSQELFNYLLTAYKMHVQKEMQAVSEAEAATVAAASTETPLPYWQTTRLNNEEFLQAMREFVAFDQNQEQRMRIREYFAEVTDNRQQQQQLPPPTTDELSEIHNLSIIERPLNNELLYDTFTNMPQLPELLSTDMSSILNEQRNAQPAAERPRIITSTRQRRPPERLGFAAIPEEGADAAAAVDAQRRNSRARTVRTRAQQQTTIERFVRLCEPFQVREMPAVLSLPPLQSNIRHLVEFHANQRQDLKFNAGVWLINNERSNTTFTLNDAQTDQIFQRQTQQQHQTQSSTTSSAASINMPRRILSMQEVSAGGSSTAGIRGIMHSNASGGEAPPVMHSAHTPTGRISLANRLMLTNSSGGQPSEAAAMLLPSVGDISLLGSAGSTPAAPPAGTITPLRAQQQQQQRVTITSCVVLPPAVLPTSSAAGASASSFLHRQNLSLIREEEFERSRRQLAQQTLVTPLSVRENPEELSWRLITEQMAAIHSEVLEVPSAPEEVVIGELAANQATQVPSVSSPPRKSPRLEPPTLIEQARRALQMLDLNTSMSLMAQFEQIQLTNEQMQPLINSSVMDTPPPQVTRGVAESYRRNWFDILRSRQQQFDYVESTERRKRTRRGTAPRQRPPRPLVDPNEHIFEAILPPMLGGRQQQLVTPDRTAPDARALLNETAEQPILLAEATTTTMMQQQAEQTLVNINNNNPDEVLALQQQQTMPNIEDVDELMPPTTQTTIIASTSVLESTVVADLAPLDAAQQRHDTFVLEHHEEISLLMDNLPLVRDMMVEYNHSLVTQRASNAVDNGVAPKQYPTLPAGYTYDADLLLREDRNKLRIKHAVLKALICQKELDLKRTNFIRKPIDAAIAFRFLLELKGMNVINLSNDGRVCSLRDREGGGYKRYGGGDGERKFGGGGGGRRRDNDENGDGERKFGGGGRRRDNDDDDFNNNKGEEIGEDGEKKKREFYIPPEPTNDETEMFASGITSGINFAKYENIPVKVSGDSVPPAIQNFESAGLREMIYENVKKSGYTVPTPIQKVAIPVIAAGRDLMACAQTGSGKTAAFLLPILSSILEEGKTLEIGKPQAIVVSPTRELTIQIYNEARKFAHNSYLKISIVYGGTSFKYQNENVAKGCHVLIATPGRLLDFINRAFITFEDTRFIVLDEADRMLDMGFLENIKTIMTHPTMSKEHQTLMFSATFPEDIQRLAGEFLANYVFAAIGVVGGACSDVQQEILEVSKFNKRAKLLEILHEDADGTIVFVETKRGADFLASFFSETEFPTTSIHGDRLQSQRESALRDFKNGVMKVLIATSVASRGLDIKNVNHVINYDMPTSIDDYVHRIGRTGRVGNRGRATSFFDPDADHAIAQDLVKILEGSKQEVPDFLRNIGGGGGGGGFSNSKFGGVDVRGKNPVGGAALEEEQDWD